MKNLNYNVKMNIKVKQILLKLIFLFLLTWGTIEGFYQFNPYHKKDLETAYTAAIIDKYQRLESLKSPKIVLIAGSNFAYGINSAMIQDSFKMPVVNMAMHYDYGTDFMLKQITPTLHKGDIVIVGFEYIADSEGNMKEKILMTKYFPKAKEWFSYKDIFQFIGENAQVRIDEFKKTLERTIKKIDVERSVNDTTSVFFRAGINEYGDLISHYNNPPMKKIPRAIINDKVSFVKPIADMNVFAEKMKKIGVKVYYTYPSYAVSSYQFDKEIIAKLNDELTKNAKFTILGKPSDFVFADSLCQDMVYHLTKNGAEIRTQKIIDLLKK